MQNSVLKLTHNEISRIPIKKSRQRVCRELLGFRNLAYSISFLRDFSKAIRTDTRQSEIGIRGGAGCFARIV